MDKKEEETEAMMSNLNKDNGEIASDGSKDDLQNVQQEKGTQIEDPEECGSGSAAEVISVDEGANKIDDVRLEEVVSNGKEKVGEVIEQPKVVEAVEEAAAASEMEKLVDELRENNNDKPLSEQEIDEIPEEPKSEQKFDQGGVEPKVVEPNVVEVARKLEEVAEETKVVEEVAEETKLVEEVAEETKLVEDEFAGKVENDKVDAAEDDEKMKVVVEQADDEDVKEKLKVVVEQADGEDVKAVDEQENPVVEHCYKGDSSGVLEGDLGREFISRSAEFPKQDSSGVIKQEIVETEDDPERADSKATGVVDGPAKTSDVAPTVADSFLVKAKSRVKHLVSRCAGDYQKFDSHSWASGLALGVVLTCSVVVLTKHLERRA